ncbi:MAG: hypothetical protein UR12_C0008G0007 [candidate division TM6 bacterium GW2011_GWF2_30_66]|nr:MAG: hypothetical protein UR12_C0008G0007 [candidate division TM6 bacterium GW2011_GWF2_30_66]
MKRTMNVLSLTLILSIAFSNTAFSGFWTTKKVKPTAVKKSWNLVKNPWTGAAVLTATCIAGLIWLNKGPKTDAPAVSEQADKAGLFNKICSLIAKPFIATKNGLVKAKDYLFTSKKEEVKKEEVKKKEVRAKTSEKAESQTNQSTPRNTKNARKCTTGNCGNKKGNGSRNNGFYGTTVK